MSSIITVNDLCLWYGSTQALKLTDEQIATVGEVTTHVMAS